MRTLSKLPTVLFADKVLEEQQSTFDWLGEALQVSAPLHIGTGPHRPLNHG